MTLSKRSPRWPPTERHVSALLKAALQELGR